MKYRFSDLVDLDQILALMTSFFELTKLPSAIVDLEGNIVQTKNGQVVGAGWKRICLDFHRVHPLTERNCIESDVRLAQEVRNSAASCYKCLNGMVDAAIPLIIDGEHLVNLFTGQFFLEPPDRQSFRMQAAKYGFDEQAYLEALDEVPVFDPDFVKRGLEFLEMLAGIIAELGLKQKRLLEQLALSQQAAEAADLAGKVRSRFFASASHDLRQPIQAVRLFIDVLAGATTATPQAAIVEKASEGLASAESILNSLFDVARIEAGMVAPSFKPVLLADLFQTLFDEWAPQAAAKNIRLKQHVAACVVTSDALMLERIVRNLLANAIRYTDSGGVLIGCRLHGEMTLVEVWDTGRGIPPEHLQGIWEEFYQVGNASRNHAEGLGLGLSIARKLAASLGHDLDVRSTPGKGTVFRLTIRPRGSALDQPPVLQPHDAVHAARQFGVVGGNQARHA